MPRGPAKKCQGLFRKMEAGEEDRPVIVLMREVSAQHLHFAIANGG